MTLQIPVLGYSSPNPGTTDLIVGTSDLTLDGKPFPWPTVGEWVVKFTDDGCALLTVNIAISLPPDPKAIKE